MPLVTCNNRTKKDAQTLIAMQYQDPAQLRAFAEKVSRWCSEQALQTTAESGFFFVTYEEALKDAGRAVADAWQRR